MDSLTYSRAGRILPCFPQLRLRVSPPRPCPVFTLGLLYGPDGGYGRAGRQLAHPFLTSPSILYGADMDH